MDARRFSQLPAPVRLKDTITSQDVHADEPMTELIVDAWMLRNAAG